MSKSSCMVFVLVLFLILGVNAFAADDLVVAKIGKAKLTNEDLNKMIGYYYDEAQAKIVEQNPPQRLMLLKNIVQGQVLSDLARKEGLDKRVDIAEQMKFVINNQLAGQYIKYEVLGKIKLSDEDIENYYKAHKEEFKTPEMVKARHILIKVDSGASEDSRKKAKEKAGAILKRVRAGEDFAKLAQEFSDDPGSKDKGGDLGFFAKGRMLPDFEKAAFALKPGGISDIVETKFGYHIIKVEEKKAEEIPALEKIKDNVRKKAMDELTQAKVKEFIDKAMKNAGAEINADYFLPKKIDKGSEAKGNEKH